MPTVRRRIAASLLAALACVSFAGSVCDGWQASGMERMACCEDEDHPCSQAAADACCGTAELRRHATSSSAMPAPMTSLPPAAFSAFVLPAPDYRESLLHLPVRRLLGSPPDTQLLLSVFLI